MTLKNEAMALRATIDRRDARIAELEGALAQAKSALIDVLANEAASTRLLDIDATHAALKAARAALAKGQA